MKDEKESQLTTQQSKTARGIFERSASTITIQVCWLFRKKFTALLVSQHAYTAIEQLSDCFTSRSEAPPKRELHGKPQVRRRSPRRNCFYMQIGVKQFDRIRKGHNRHQRAGLCIKLVFQSGTSYRAETCFKLVPRESGQDGCQGNTGSWQQN